MQLCNIHRRALRVARLAAGLALAACFPAALLAQPFGLWTTFVGDGTADNSNGYLNIPSAAALNPTSAITLEAWVSVELPFAAQTCRSLIGKDYNTSYWVGICGNQLRSYTHGVSSAQTSGIVPNGPWTHVAVTSDGTTRKHYIDGELVGTFAETAPLTTSPAPLEIGGDTSWVYSPNGSINEVRLWNVVRTQAEIQASINVPLRTAQAGLVAVWPMGGPHDALGGHDGTFVGKVPPILGPPAAITCGSSTAQSFCLDGKFIVTANWRIGDPGSTDVGNATTVPSDNAGSGVFWFFNATDWEVLVKVLNGCGVNNKWWVFSAATTNLYYELIVTNVQSGQSKIYFNYPGPPAPALTDVAAFDCP